MTTGSVSRHLVFCRLPWRGPTVLSWKGCWLFLAISTLCRSECYVVVVFLHSFYRQDRGVLWRQLSRHSDTDVAHTASSQAVLRPLPVSPHQTGGAPVLLLEGLATNLQSAVIERLRDVPGRDQWSQNLAKRSTHFLSSGCPTLFDDAEPVGGSAPVRVFQASSAVFTRSSAMSSDSGGSRFAWSSLVFAAEARKAERASGAAGCIPRPPSFTGRESCSHFSSDSSTSKMLDSPLLSSESNPARLGQSTQRAVRIV